MTIEITTLETPASVNGVDVAGMLNMIDEINADPAQAAFRFRARNRWITGAHNRSTIQGFTHAGREDETRATPFVIENDEPEVLAGVDNGPNPVEHVLQAVAGCMTTTLVYHAAVRGIEIRAVSSEVHGDIDIRGLLGLSADVRKGCHHIGVTIEIESDAPVEELRELCLMSAVYDIVSNSLPVDVVVKKV